MFVWVFYGIEYRYLCTLTWMGLVPGTSNTIYESHGIWVYVRTYTPVKCLVSIHIHTHPHNTFCLNVTKERNFSIVGPYTIERGRLKPRLKFEMCFVRNIYAR